jgi:hypothetical protein
MRIVITLLFAFVFTRSYAQEALRYQGFVGTYPVELLIENNDEEYGLVSGTYRYMKKTTYIEIQGEVGPPVVYLEEYVNGDTTGYWYLEMNGDSLTGKWVGNGLVYDVVLEYTTGDRSLLSRKTEHDYNKEVNGDLTGEYEVNEYFINDMWVTEENLHPELGYNGGVLTIEELDEGRIEFMVEAVCGPTYHIAYAEGIAEKSGSEYVYRNGECLITFTFNNKRVKVSAASSMDCEFGARAYLGHEFIKVSNSITETGEY